MESRAPSLVKCPRCGYEFFPYVIQPFTSYIRCPKCNKKIRRDVLYRRGS